jgi:hypothetical protein
MHVRCPDRLPEETYRQVLEQLADRAPSMRPHHPIQDRQWWTSTRLSRRRRPHERTR